MVSWRKRGGKCGDVRSEKCEGVSVVEVGRVTLPLRLLADPALQCQWDSLQQWDGRERMDRQRERRDFSLRDTQDLACLLATHQVTHVIMTRTVERYLFSGPKSCLRWDI